MADILTGILILLAGIGFVLLGLRIFFLLLPVWGFIGGFFLGAALIANWFGDSFLSSVGGWILGIILGLAFAFLSYLYWYIGAIFTAASAGGLVGSGLMALLGVDTGWIVLIVALIGAFLFGFAAIMLNLPVYVVIVNTALAGSFAVITGLILLLDRVDLDELGFGGAWVAINDSAFWLLVWVAIAAIGIGYQVTQIPLVPLPAERWIRADARARQMAAISSDRESR